MATVTVASSNPSFSHTFFTLDDNLPGPGRPREASFSSYLSAADESFSLRLSGEFTDHRNTNSVQVTLGSGRKKVAAKDDELDVFGAEKYFNGVMDSEEVEIKSEKTWKESPLKEPVEPILTSRRTRLGTPSTCSEASGNSRSRLLRDARRERSRNNPPRPHPAGKKFLGIFPCSCSDGLSVEVDKDKKGSDGGGFTVSRRLGPEQAARQEFWCNEETLWRRGAGTGSGFITRREDYFSFPPVLNAVRVGNSTVGPKMLQEDQKLARVSPMDVFGAPFLGKEELATSLRRSLTIMNPFSGGGGRGGTRVDDDVCSDASSDLFEIESLSTGTFPLGGAGGTSTSTTCYEPSEASIEWSVVTASAANFSLASDGEVSPPKARRQDGRHHQQRSGGGLLLGCGSAKAVNVVPTAYRAQEFKAEVAQQQRQHHKSMDAVMAPEIRYYAETPRSVDFEHGRAAHVLAPRGIPRPAPPHSPRLQLPLL
ncbi:hypothetical protein Taro_031277 [Colocasia esculenta]|uniref:Uncharacterized protein n=1 Tax=Colocasia esculenta TaxID=4460 RepID=A0A843W2P2_COLES|nr:hypothetical protein [Colocasia esculenta]